jgi:peptidyl-prolyl cis-trans isomerase A (cyclophilin A)
MKHVLFFALSVILSLSIQAKGNPVVVIETSHGDVEIELFEKKAPITVKNFLGYVKSGFYNGTIFHRVIDNFMLQGGGFSRDLGRKNTKAPIKNEATNRISNTVGTIAMARTGDVNSATAQFFINVKDNTFLDHRDQTAKGFGYAVFGKVIKGMPVVNRIKKMKTQLKAAFPNMPTQEVYIKTAKKK